MIVTGRLCEKYPAATEHLYITLVIQRETGDYYVAAQFFTADPT